MFTIGEFARHGRVSVRMLRHYDALGLLRPARVDARSGYRSYEAAQLARLNRIVALKDLGFTLDQVGSILDEQLTAGELRGMLRLRRAELETAAADAARRLAGVAARLRTIESEGRMPATDVVLKSVPAVRVAELSGSAASFEPADVGPVIQPLYEEVCRRLDAAGVEPTGPGVAWYEDAADGTVTVHAGLQVGVGPSPAYDFAVTDLPPLDTAATTVHRGDMDAVLPAVQALAAWIDENGYRSTGYPRELYLEVHECHADWVTELQEPVTPA
ncbi:MerR family transcriptional regulator [Streptomyces aculeolatus]